MTYLFPKIIPYLLIKQEQAENVLEFLALPRGSRDHPLLEKYVERREELYYRCRALNARGSDLNEKFGNFKA